MILFFTRDNKGLKIEVQELDIEYIDPDQDHGKIYDIFS